MRVRCCEGSPNLLLIHPKLGVTPRSLNGRGFLGVKTHFTVVPNCNSNLKLFCAYIDNGQVFNYTQDIVAWRVETNSDEEEFEFDSWSYPVSSSPDSCSSNTMTAIINEESEDWEVSCLGMSGEGRNSLIECLAEALKEKASREDNDPDLKN